MSVQIKDGIFRGLMFQDSHQLTKLLSSEDSVMPPWLIAQASTWLFQPLHLCLLQVTYWSLGGWGFWVGFGGLVFFWDTPSLLLLMSSFCELKFRFEDIKWMVICDTVFNVTFSSVGFESTGKLCSLPLCCCAENSERNNWLMLIVSV